MGTRVTYIRLPEPGTSNLKGVGHNRSREFCVGADCLNEWGGGKIVSMEIDRGLQAVVIRKSGQFVSPVPGDGGKRETFDAVCVPLASLSQFTVVDDKQEEQPVKPADPPPARPVQQQGNQQRR